MSLEFSNEIDRRNTGAVKWEIIQDRDEPEKWIKTDAYYGNNRILPMWVADMDLPGPEAVRKALADRATHPIYGYTMADDSYYEAVMEWMKRRHDWKIKREWIVTTPGVIPALHVFVRTFTLPGQKVLIQRPVYYPFFSVIENNNRRVVSNSLFLTNGKYMMDFDDLDRKTADSDVTMAILCSPHNPVGRVWEPEEIRNFVEICRKNDVFIVSDEIHGDLIYPEYTFTPFGISMDESTQNCAVCTSPSKTFNLAGLQNANIIIPGDENRRNFRHGLKSIGYLGPNPFAVAACKAAYTEGNSWLQDLLDYLNANKNLFIREFAEHIPHIPVINPQGTYLIWFDCRALNLTHQELRKLMIEKARVFLDEGYIFGPEGIGFERINVACPRPVLKEALERISSAILSVSS